MPELQPYTDQSYNDIVFENRNKQYGSYALRALIRRHTFISLLSIITIVAIIIALFRFHFNFFNKQEEVILTPVEITLSEPPPILESLPPAVPPSAEKMATDQLHEMEVKRDDQVAEKKDDTEKKDEVDSLSHGTDLHGSDHPSQETGNGSTVYLSVEEMPVYPGGKIGLTKYLKDNLEYPKEAKENGIQGTVFVIFVVNEDGSVSDVKLKKGIGGGCDQEAIRVVKEMRKWKPGKQGGAPVKVYQQLPIVFKLTGN